MRRALVLSPHVFVPPPALGNLLYVRASAGPTAGDSAFMSLFQAAGWSLGDYPTGYADNIAIPGDMSPHDVVFISESCTSTNVGTKWNGVTQGIVNAENGAWDDMLLAAAAATISARTTWDITNPGHALAAGYSGEVAVVSSAAQMRASSSDTNAYGAIQVANFPSAIHQDFMWAYERGQNLSNGSTPAAGRRVAMGLHSDTMQVLTAIGEDLLLGALAWAAAPVPATIDIRANDVVYAQVLGAVEFGNTWDRTYPVASSTNKRVSGFRFQVNIPPGATITSATLETTHAQNATWSAPADDLDVAFEQSDSTSMATNEPNAETLSANIGSTVNWSITGAKVTGDKFVTPDLTTLLQAIVNRVGWASGNFVTIWAISDGGGNDAHQMWAVTGVTEANKPRLQVGYES